MRQDLHSPNIFDADVKSARLSHARHILIDDARITEYGPMVTFFDPNGAERIITLPENREGLFYTISNVGVGFNLVVKDAAGNTEATIQPTQTLTLWSSEIEWQGTKATTDLDVFTNTVDGLVPAPNSITPGSLFLRDDGQWAQVQVVGIVDAFKYISDGTNIAVGAGPDTFTLRSSSGKVGITVTNNEAVFGDNANLTVNEAAIDHNLLLNYVADQHVAHSGVSITAGVGLSGGGDISASRTLNLSLGSLIVDTPTLVDGIPFADASGGDSNIATVSAFNAILDHNALLNYVADRHVLHSGVSIVAGVGLSGGGDISVSRTLNLNINGLVADTLASADEFAFYDSSGADHNKITFANLVASIDHNSLLNYSANRHIDHTAVSITGTGMLAGGGNIDASRTLNLASAAALTVLANITGGSAVPTANTITQFLDAMIGSTRGMVAVRGAATWQSLALGANNTYLKSNGTDLTYATIAAGGDLLSTNNLSDVANRDTSATNLRVVSYNFAQTTLTAAEELQARVNIDADYFEPGDFKLSFRTSMVSTRWVKVDDGSIGNAASGATTRANADTVDAFTALYNAISALVVQDSSGSTVARGASAAADYAANRRLVIPKMLGRVIAVAGAGSGLTSRTLGANAGAETETPTTAKTAAHPHTLTGYEKNTGVDLASALAGTAGPWFGGSDYQVTSTMTTSSVGSGSVLNIIDPSIYANVFLRL